MAGAFGRELTSEELITVPRPGEEYVHIQTGNPGQPVAPVRLEGKHNPIYLWRYPVFLSILYIVLSGSTIRGLIQNIYISVT